MTAQPHAKRNSGPIRRAMEYTDLRKAMTYRDIETMCLEASVYGLGTIVVPSALVKRAVMCSAGDDINIGSVVSYPFGSQSPCVKAREAAVAVEHGATELDIVPHFGAILAERWEDVALELSAVREAATDVTLKLVLETGRLSSDQIHHACLIAADHGFDYIVNTVGFRLVSTDPDAEGAASAPIVKSLCELAGDALCIKAAGGVSTLQGVMDLLDAGAQRVAVPVLPGLLRSMDWSLDDEAAS